MKEKYYCGIMSHLRSHGIGYNPNLLKHFHRYLCLLTGIRNVFYIYISRYIIGRSKET